MHRDKVSTIFGVKKMFERGEGIEDHSLYFAVPGIKNVVPFSRFSCGWSLGTNLKLEVE